MAISTIGRTGFVSPLQALLQRVNGYSLTEMHRWPSDTNTARTCSSRYGCKSEMFSRGFICSRIQQPPTSSGVITGGAILNFPSPLPDGGFLSRWRKVGGSTQTRAWLQAVGGDYIIGDDGEGLSAGDDGKGLSTEFQSDGMAAEEEENEIEVSEEDMMQEWVERGLDPEMFDPMVLIEMWEAEDFNDEVGLPLLSAVQLTAYGYFHLMSAFQKS